MYGFPSPVFRAPPQDHTLKGFVRRAQANRISTSIITTWLPWETTSHVAMVMSPRSMALRLMRSKTLGLLPTPKHRWLRRGGGRSHASQPQEPAHSAHWHWRYHRNCPLCADWPGLNEWRAGIAVRGLYVVVGRRRLARLFVFF